MINLQQRCYQKELMDADDIPFDAMAQTLRELNVINTRLGGHAITLSGAAHFLQKGKQSVVCEIGCGGGDNLNAIYKHVKNKNPGIRFIGIDMNSECIRFAKEQYPELPCQWICSDYTKVNFQQPPDVIFSSLFCHHFTDKQLISMLQWLKSNSQQGFFINDLQRHWLAYYLIKYITKFFSKSTLVKNDACLSVARSFRRKEWQLLMEQSGVETYSINWRWAFRFLVLHKNSSSK